MVWYVSSTIKLFRFFSTLGTSEKVEGGNIKNCVPKILKLLVDLVHFINILGISEE